MTGELGWRGESEREERGGEDRREDTLLIELSGLGMYGLLTVENIV